MSRNWQGCSDERLAEILEQAADGHPNVVAFEAMKVAAERLRAGQADAERYRRLRDTLQGAVGGGVEVNDDRLSYSEPEPGQAVRVFWYPDTPVGFYQTFGDSLDEAIDKLKAAP